MRDRYGRMRFKHLLLEGPGSSKANVIGIVGVLFDQQSVRSWYGRMRFKHLLLGGSGSSRECGIGMEGLDSNTHCWKALGAAEQAG